MSCTSPFPGENTHTYRNPYFGRQYDGARGAGLIRGAYHFALPDKSSGRAQAAHFVRNGGGRRPDGWTLPPALDIEYNPYGEGTCHGLSKARMAARIQAFSDEVKRLTGRHPAICTTQRVRRRNTAGRMAVVDLLAVRQRQEPAG